MSYDFGGIFDFLDDIHFPKAGGAKFPPWQSQPYYYFLQEQNPTYFSYLGGVWGDGWGARHNLPVIKILAADTQKIVPTEVVGHPSLEAAADAYVANWDAGHPLAVESFGRMNPQNKFFWKVLGRKFPGWASNLSGLASSRPNDPNPPIGPYIKKAMDDYFSRWNNDSNAYNQVANTVEVGWQPLTQHSFAVPFPHPTSAEHGTFAGLAKQLADQTAWFGPLPESAWTRFLIIFTQSYCFSYGFGQLDPSEWDLSAWPPRRTSIRQDQGGSKNRPSTLTGNYSGKDPFIDFIDHQFRLV